MTISKTKPGGWAYTEVLTYLQISAVDANVENALDKRVGQTDTLASAVTVTGALKVSGTLNLSPTVTSVSATGALSATSGYFILVNSSGGAITLTLPATQNGRVFKILDVGGAAATNNITIATPSTETIGGLTADYVMDAGYQSIELVADASSNWWLISS